MRVAVEQSHRHATGLMLKKSKRRVEKRNATYELQKLWVSLRVSRSRNHLDDMWRI